MPCQRGMPGSVKSLSLTSLFRRLTELHLRFASVKYIHKYIFKGHDRTSLEVEGHDEIREHIDGRFLGASEGTWRIFHFNMHGESPNVIRLDLHLPGQHLVHFNPDDNPADVIERASNEMTKLTSFFKANQDPGGLGEVARQLTYQEFPQKLVWSKKKGWTVRKQGFALGRMYFASPTSGERFYLRTLLTVVRGSTSFEDLRTVAGILCPTFRDACVGHGLLEDDGEWVTCLQDASQMQTGTSLRQLFGSLLLFCTPTDPSKLWEQFREFICDDLAYRIQTRYHINHPSQEQVYDLGLYLLERILNSSGKSLKNFDLMPQPVFDWDLHTGNALITEQLDYNREAESNVATAMVAQLNPEQRASYDTVLSAVLTGSGETFFLSGPGGTGKTFVYRTLCHALRGTGWIVICVASSGIAALLLPGGRTSHSMLKIPVEGLGPESHCSIDKEDTRAELLRSTSLIIWDEVPMQHRFGPEAVSRTLMDIRDDSRPFGGLTVVFGGDFRQILPVVRRGSPERIIGASVCRSSIWRRVRVLKLHRNQRLDHGQATSEFASWLLKIGSGGQARDCTVPIPPSMVVGSADELLDFVYPGLNTLPEQDFFRDRAILAARNSDVSRINHGVLEQLYGKEIVLFSADMVVTELGADATAARYPVEFLRSLEAPGLPPGELHVKIGCPLILLINLSPSRGLCNGTRMVLCRVSHRILEVSIIGGSHHGSIALIPRVSLTPNSDGSDFPFVLRRRQFPVRLAFAMSINKSQGQSLKVVGIDLRVPVFTHGQLYVALSRATSGNRIRILLPRDSKGETTNIVFPEVLLN